MLHNKDPIGKAGSELRNDDVGSPVSSRPSRHGKADGRMGCSRRGMTGRKEIVKAKRGYLSRISNQERSWRSKQMVSRTYNNASKLKRDQRHTRTSRTRSVAVGKRTWLLFVDSVKQTTTGSLHGSPSGHEVVGDDGMDGTSKKDVARQVFRERDAPTRAGFHSRGGGS